MTRNRTQYKAAKQRYERRKSHYRKLGVDIASDIAEYVKTIDVQQDIIREQEKWIREQAKQIEELKRQLFDKNAATAKREATRMANIAAKGDKATKAEQTRLINYNTKQDNLNATRTVDIQRIIKRFEFAAKLDEASYRGHETGMGVAKDVGNAYTHYDELIRDWLDKKGNISLSDRGLSALTKSAKFKERFMALAPGSISDKNEAWRRFKQGESAPGNRIIFDYRKIK